MIDLHIASGPLTTLSSTTCDHEVDDVAKATNDEVGGLASEQESALLRLDFESEQDRSYSPSC